IRSVYTVEDAPVVEITLVDLMEANLIGHPNARRRRERLSDLLQIGQVNGKGLKKRLEMFRISKEKLKDTVQVLDKEEEK
ncbi:DUF4093 domain-containing protein, partial [Microvirga sp. 3-52]|nr:DUF4093 domain-containing protein [Microvirga sp. 3-52]